jgi:integration host factor subunit beta
MTMTKADLVETVADAADVPRKQADEVVQVILESIITALRRNEKVELRGFGSFRIRQRGERTGRNPKTGEQGGRNPLRPMAARVRVDSRRT